MTHDREVQLLHDEIQAITNLFLKAAQDLQGTIMGNLEIMQAQRARIQKLEAALQREGKS